MWNRKAETAPSYSTEPMDLLSPFRPSTKRWSVPDELSQQPAAQQHSSVNRRSAPHWPIGFSRHLVGSP